MPKYKPRGKDIGSEYTAPTVKSDPTRQRLQQLQDMFNDEGGDLTDDFYNLLDALGQRIGLDSSAMLNCLLDNVFNYRDK